MPKTLWNIPWIPSNMLHFYLQTSATASPLCPSIRRTTMTIRMRWTRTRASIGCSTSVRMAMYPRRRRPRNTLTHICLQNWDSGGVYNFKLYTNCKTQQKNKQKPANYKLLNYLIAKTTNKQKIQKQNTKKANQQNLMKLSCV